MTIFTDLETQYNTAANWASGNPVLGANVMALETDTGRVKIGNGILAYNTLPYMDTPDPVLAARMMATLSAPLKTTWAARPAANAVSAGAQIRVVDTWTPPQGIIFTSNGTHWVPLNGECVLYDWDLSALSTTSTTLANVSGFVSPAFPWADLLAVPGFLLETTLFADRASPANTQTARIDVAHATALNSQFLVAIPAASLSPEFRAYGRMGWSRTGFVRRAISIAGTTGGENPSVLSSQASMEAATPGNAAVALMANTGGAGETMTFRLLQLRYSVQ